MAKARPNHTPVPNHGFGGAGKISNTAFPESPGAESNPPNAGDGPDRGAPSSGPSVVSGAQRQAEQADKEFERGAP